MKLKDLKCDDHGVYLDASFSFLPWHKERSPVHGFDNAPKELRRQLQKLHDDTQAAPAGLLTIGPTGVSLNQLPGPHSWAQIRQLLKELDIAIDQRERGIIVEDGAFYDEFSPRLRGDACRAARERARNEWKGDPRHAPCCDNEVRGMNGGCANCGMPCL